jgi:hypothetical protein
MLGARSRELLETLLPGLYEAGFERFYEDFQKKAPPQMLLGFRAALLVGVWISPLLIFRLPPFTRLTQEDRLRALEALGKSDIYLLRQIMLLLKAVACFCYGANPAVRKDMGYPA